MCGRFALYSQKKILSKFKIKVDKNYTISPSQKVLIINQELRPVMLNWGLKPSWKKTLIINEKIF